MRHPQPSEVQRGLSGGVYVIVMEGVINVVKYWHEPIYLLYETNNAQYFGHFILRNIAKIVATRRHILQLKCTKLDFVWGSAYLCWNCCKTPTN